MNFVTRRFEWQADEFATLLSNKIPAEKLSLLPDVGTMGDRLGDALIALHRENKASVWVDWLCVCIFSCRPWRGY